MSSDTSETSNPVNDAEPDTADLQEPSTEKAPGDEPTSPDPEAAQGDGDEPSHQAVGIGVIGAPLVDPENIGGTKES